MSFNVDILMQDGTAVNTMNTIIGLKNITTGYNKYTPLLKKFSYSFSEGISRYIRKECAKWRLIKIGSLKPLRLQMEGL